MLRQSSLALYTDCSSYGLSVDPLIPLKIDWKTRLEKYTELLNKWDKGGAGERGKGKGGVTVDRMNLLASHMSKLYRT